MHRQPTDGRQTHSWTLVLCPQGNTTALHSWLQSAYKSRYSLILLWCTSSYSVLEQTSAVLLPQLQNFSHAPQKNSIPLLPQEQNVTHQTKVLLFCYHNCRMFLTREIFCKLEQNVSPKKKILLFCYHKTTTLCCSVTTMFFNREIIIPLSCYHKA